MFQIDYVQNFENETIEFVSDHNSLFETLNVMKYDALHELLNVFNDYHIESDNTDCLYNSAILNDNRFNKFNRDFNEFIINTRVELVSNYNTGIVYLIVNDKTLGSTEHISDYDMDMLCDSHIYDYCNMGIDFDDIKLNHMAEMISRFIRIVRLMNGDD